MVNISNNKSWNYSPNWSTKSAVNPPGKLPVSSQSENMQLDRFRITVKVHTDMAISTVHKTSVSKQNRSKLGWVVIQTFEPLLVASCVSSQQTDSFAVTIEGHFLHKHQWLWPTLSSLFSSEFCSSSFSILGWRFSNSTDIINWLTNHLAAYVAKYE